MKRKEFIEKAKKALGEENYSFLKTTYIDSHTKVIITCKKHGDFLVEPTNVISHKSGCPLCRPENISKSKTSNTKEFIEKAKKIHGDKYDYSLVDYKHSQKKIKIICPEHGIFEQTPNNHLKGEGCPHCKH